MPTTNDFYNGMTFMYDGDILEVCEFMHVKPGKGPAFVRAKVRNMRTGSNVERTFRAGEKVEQIRLEEKRMQYLYRDGGSYVFMDNETYDQIQISEEQLGDNKNYLKENENIKALFNGTEILGIEVAQFMDLEVVETDPGLKGNTVSGGTKPATLETGAVVRVPLFLNVGDKIKVDTRLNKYLERVKSSD
jgi:elongation factor P